MDQVKSPAQRCAEWARNNPWSIAIPFGACFAVVFATLIIGWYTFFPTPPGRPPSTVLKATLLTPEVEVGGVMILHIEAREGQPERVCGGTVKREFWRKSKYRGRDIYSRWKTDLVAAAIYVPEQNLMEYLVPIPLEDKMPVGEYLFYGETVNICGPEPKDTIVVKSFIPKVMVVAKGTARVNPDIIQ